MYNIYPQNNSVSPPPPSISFITYYMRARSNQFLCILYGAPSDQFLHILYMRAPSDQFLYILYGAPFISVSFHTIWRPPRIIFFAYYMVTPSNQFLCILYGPPPEISFFTYYIGPTRFCILCWGPPQITFIAHYMGLPHMIISLSSDTIWVLPQICFFTYYMLLAYYIETPSNQFLCIL